jgi:hypothetical protein
LSAADRALADKAKASGTAFKSRDEATKSFQAKYATQYTSKYASEPSTRPTHIPSTYSTGGNTYNVVYNSGYGGYGYYRGSSWYAYDTFTDAIILSSLMHHHNYYHYPSGYYDSYGNTQVVYSDGGSAFFAVFMTVIGIVFVFVIISIIFGRYTR